MRYSCKKTATYNNIKIFCGNAKSTFHLFKTPRAKKYLTRIRLIITHVTLTHTTLSNRETARLRKRKASYGDRLASSLESYNVEKSVKSKVFAGKVNKKN
jgi:hypothetical protein